MTYSDDFDDITRTTAREQSGLAGGAWDFARTHPLPTALVGLGLGYLAVTAASGRRPGPSREQLQRMAQRARSTAARARSRANDLSAEARRGGSQVAQEAVDRAHAVADAAEGRARRAAAAVRRQASEMGQGVDSYARSHPFVVGAIAFGLGAAMGGLLPRALDGSGGRAEWPDEDGDDDYGAAAFSGGEMQGEGDYRAAHHYRESAERFSETDDPGKRARQAAADLERDPETFRQAEATGRKPASNGSKGEKR